MVSSESALGAVIERLIVSAEEFDALERRVGADTVVLTSDARHWLLQLMTRQHFANQEIGGVLEEKEDPGTYIAAHEEGLKRQPPYVLNDAEITNEVLERKFIGREVGEDLAISMIYIEPEAEDKTEG